MNTTSTVETTPSVLFELRGVCKEYTMGEVVVPALRGASLTIQRGELLVILGPSGSGKSTLLNIIGGLDAPTRGEVMFRGQDLARFNESQRTQYRRKHIGFVFQFYNLMPNLTAEENVELATEISTDPMAPAEALDMVHLGERRTHFPSQLSGGEQQRVAIARAVAKRPEILLCDEPTGALDIATGKVVLEALCEINRRVQTTLILITHNASIAGLADRVVEMRDGEVHHITINEKRQSVDDLAW